jgi:formylglycine-generating enzyme required for sulfatase activity
MDFVTIGNTNNAGDPDGSPTNCGAVAYEYRIGKYEVSEHQFSCTSGPGNENHKPKAWITWYEAVRFCNWLTTGSEETGLYVFVEGEFESIRNRQDAAEEYGVVYCLPTEDEWYKAAYYDPDKPGGAGYWDSPAGTNTMYARPPAEDDGAAANAEHVASGTTVEIDAYPLSASPYGTQQQAGNVYEWNETSIDTNRGCRGGSYYHDISDAYRGESSSYTPDGVAGSIGFRVVAIGDAFYHSLMATAEEHGSVSPGPSVRVRNGSNVLFTITTDEYWHIDDVTTNGTSIGPVTSFVWSNVTQRGVVYVSTAPDLAAGGTPHWWLASFGWTNHFDAVETGNPDADAFTTGEEYIADTDPTNGFSFLSITSLISATDCTVHFISSSNRLYNLKGCSNLTTGAWSNVPGATARTGVGGNDALSDTNTPLLGPYYRLGVKVPE